MTNKLTFKHIEREIKAQFYSLDEKILFGKQKTITNLINSMNAKQYNLFKKYLSYEKRLKTILCKEIICRCIKSIKDHPDLYNLSDLTKDTKI